MINEGKSDGSQVDRRRLEESSSFVFSQLRLDLANGDSISPGDHMRDERFVRNLKIALAAMLPPSTANSYNSLNDILSLSSFETDVVEDRGNHTETPEVVDDNETFEGLDVDTDTAIDPNDDLIERFSSSITE